MTYKSDAKRMSRQIPANRLPLPEPAGLPADTETGQVESPDLVGEGSEVRLELTYGKHRDNPRKWLHSPVKCLRLVSVVVKHKPHQVFSITERGPLSSGGRPLKQLLLLLWPIGGDG